MSWPVASFAIVLGVLIAGWFAYERSRPSARMAAVVGTLAALAALGRDAFVAIPDVKPITAMTLVVGYALGPLAGFAVGSVGMLASNILLGQGPYTPWQMAAWGLVGLVGSGLGALSARGMGRLSLSLACALSAMGAKEIMNIYTWTIGASHTPAALLAAAGASLPFDLTDAVASALFGLVFGPELARMLGRMRARMTVTWEPAAGSLPLLASLAAVMLAGGLSGSRPARASAGKAPIAGAVAYLARAQNADGGFGAEASQPSSEIYSAWAAIGLAAADRDPLALRRGGHTVLDSLEAQASSLDGAGDLERTILALRACGAPAHGYVKRLLRYGTADGSFGHLANLTAFGILALRAAGTPPSDPQVRTAARWLATQQKPDGGFSYTAHGSSDVDDTAAALQAVVSASVPAGPVVSQALGFLASAQNGDGGYPQEPGQESNAQSTAWAIQGLVAAGRNPRSAGRGRSPISYLERRVGGDGSVHYSATSDQTPVWVTAEALAALAGKPLPVAPAPPGSSSAAQPKPSVQKDEESEPSVGRPPSGTRPASRRNTVAKQPSRTMTSAQLDSLALHAGRLLAVVLAPSLRR